MPHPTPFLSFIHLSDIAYLGLSLHSCWYFLSLSYLPSRRGQLNAERYFFNWFLWILSLFSKGFINFNDSQPDAIAGIYMFIIDFPLNLYWRGVFHYSFIFLICFPSYRKRLFLYLQAFFSFIIFPKHKYSWTSSVLFFLGFFFHLFLRFWGTLRCNMSVLGFRHRPKMCGWYNA